jgi:hypothetical protein
MVGICERHLSGTLGIFLDTFKVTCMIRLLRHLQKSHNLFEYLICTSPICNISITVYISMFTQGFMEQIFIEGREGVVVVVGGGGAVCIFWDELGERLKYVFKVLNTIQIIY